ACESDPGELPPFFRLKKIAIGAADMGAGSGAGTAAQHVLVAHEFAVVFAERSGRGAIARIRRVGTARPFPDVAKHLLDLSLTWRFAYGLPPRFPSHPRPMSSSPSGRGFDSRFC